MRCGAAVFLKCENLQHVGAFKFRGAMNALLQLDDCRSGRGDYPFLGQPCAGSGPGRPSAGRPGDHGDASDGPGGEASGDRGLWVRGSCSASRRSTRARRPWPPRSTAIGLTLVHPYNDWNVIAGQGDGGVRAA